MFKKAFDFFIFSSLYISLCAVLMTFQTLQLTGHRQPSLNLILFIFFSTICSYNFHWYLSADATISSTRVQWTRHHKTLHLILYLVGLSGSAFYFYLLIDHWFAIIFGVFFTFLYSAPKLPQPFFKDLKKIAVGKTIFLAFVWMYVTTILPIIIEGVKWENEFFLFSVSRFFLIYSICILFDYRDREDDKRDNIRSMITYFNERGINNLFAASLMLFGVSSIALYWFSHSVFLSVIILIPGILLGFLYNYAKKNFSDYLYYFILDGLMMLSGLLMLVFRI